MILTGHVTLKETTKDIRKHNTMQLSIPLQAKLQEPKLRLGEIMG